jgi:hypothetical protein
MSSIILNESGFDPGMSFEDYCAAVVAHGGDNPADFGDFEQMVFVSKSYAQADSDWDVDEDWPDDLPVWEYRPGK